MAIVAVVLAFISGSFSSRAVQNPTISLDMITTGNGYCDSAGTTGDGITPCPAGQTNNSMTVGTIDNCQTEALNNAAHNRASNHLIIQNVEDLVGWQARFNYLANKMRLRNFNSTPFTDSGTAQSVGFTNLPIDSGTLLHRDVTFASSIDLYPESNVSVASAAGATTITVANSTGFAAGQTIGIGSVADRETGRVISTVSANDITFSPALVNAHAASTAETVNVTDQTPQTALVGAAYNGTQTAAISPDTPAKAAPDDTSYTANTGGVLENLVLRIEPDQGGQPSLFMNLDDNSPNPAGTTVVVFNGTGTTTMNLASSALGDGYVGQGTTCVPLDCVTMECPPTASPAATATASASPTASPTPTVSPTATSSPSATTGRGTVPANATSVTIPFVSINSASSVVLITPLSDPGTNILWVSLGTNQFTVNVRAIGSQKHPPIQFMYQVTP